MSRSFIPSIDAWNSRGVLSVVGQTGTGKTNLVLDFVRRQFTDPKTPLLVSVDSVAQFRELSIGSAKPLANERYEFNWAGLDEFSIGEAVSVADFLDRVQPAILEALAAARPVILVGGSHFYERALVIGRGPGQASDAEFQKSLKDISNPDLLERLCRFDSRWRQRVHPNDRYRLSRFLDLVERQKISFDAIVTERNRILPSSTTLIHGQNYSTTEIGARLEMRIKMMFQAGWLDEVKNLLANGFASDCPGLASIGYREIVQGLENNQAIHAMQSAILTSHMQLAKKQRTWLRNPAFGR